MQRASLPVRIIALLCATAMFIIAGVATAAVADDYLARDVMPAGSSVSGVDVSGLTRTQARARVARVVAAPLVTPVTVAHEGQPYPLDPSRLVSVDVTGSVNAAFAGKASQDLFLRILNRALARPVGLAVPLKVALDGSGLDAWLNSAAASIETTPSDATMRVGSAGLEIVPSRRGVSIDREATRKALAEAITSGRKQAEFAVKYTEPAVTESSLGPTILVDISQRRLYLYDNGQLVKKYGVAVGTAAHPTPRGDFEIVEKRYMPSWSNPGSAWAASMPKTIPPGVRNPLGTRALNLNASGIRIHGTTKDGSIGTAASHGCMRMHRRDIEDLYERVDVGTRVFIVG